MDKSYTTTAFDLPGYHVVENLGVVISAADTRFDAFDLLMQYAEEAGANALIGVRCTVAHHLGSVYTVLLYGTAVVVEPQQQ